MGKVILLTGGTGFLGSHIAARLLRDGDIDRIFVLARASTDEDAARRVSAGLSAVDPQWTTFARAGRLVPLRGDVTADRLGLAPVTGDALSREVTHVIHSAACVDFGNPLADARRINVGGTMEVLRAARAMERLEMFSHIGTAYVNGGLQRLIAEDDLEAGVKFGNSYEQSKFEAEQCVRELMPSMPICVLRPSIIVGNSRTGITTSFNVLYAPLKAIYNGLVKVLPGSPTARLDIVPVDFVAKAVCAISLAGPKAAGRTFHLTSGVENLAAAGEVLARAISFFNERAGKNVEQIRFVEPGLFAEYLESLGGPARRVAGAVANFLPYLTRTPMFDNRNAREFLGEVDLPPAFGTYYRPILQYCIDTNWGRSARIAA